MLGAAHSLRAGRSRVNLLLLAGRGARAVQLRINWRLSGCTRVASADGCTRCLCWRLRPLPLLQVTCLETSSADAGNTDNARILVRFACCAAFGWHVLREQARGSTHASLAWRALGIPHAHVSLPPAACGDTRQPEYFPQQAAATLSAGPRTGAS